MHRFYNVYMVEKFLQLIAVFFFRLQWVDMYYFPDVPQNGMCLKKVRIGHYEIFPSY